MPTVPVMDAKGQAKPGLELSADVFGVAPRVPLMHQAVVRELADRRAGTHSTRGRSQVSGGGKKPWRQKGTGRARQGSTRATQWKGGGKPFGPKPRRYDKRMPTAMRRAALREALAAKVAAGHVVVVERFELAEPRTRTVVSALRAVGVGAAPALLVVSETSEALRRAGRNVSGLAIETPGHISVYQVLRAERLVFERAALVALEAALGPGAKAAAGGQG